MPQVSFVLKEPSGRNVSLVYLLFRFNGAKLKYSTGQKIDPRYWNPEKQRAKETRQFPEYSNFNFFLNQLESTVNSCFRTMIVENITPNPELLREKLNEVLKKKSSPTKDLASFAETVLESSDRKEGTKRAIRQTIRNLNQFKVKTGKSLHFDTVDLDFYDRYIEYAQGCGYSQNTIGTQIKNIKVFMREAFERGLTKNSQFQSKRFKKPGEDSESIYLTEEELNRMYELNLSDNSRLDRVRDLFLIGCYTGLRFSDLTQLRIEHINKVKRVIKLRTGKTGEVVVIPIGGIVGTIIDKYAGDLPTTISNEKMNAYLKELALLAALDEKVEKTMTKGGKRLKVIYSKAELVTVHTARRSFATNAFLKNVPAISIMKITGHRTEKSFMKYIKISQEDNANKLIDHPFFN